MRENYKHELDALHKHLTKIAKAVKTSVKKSVKAYAENDEELAHELFSDDLRINAETADIEKRIYKIVALQQPVANDLRMIFAVLHISRDLERMGDHAVTIARATVRQQKNDTKEIEEINQLLNKMGKAVQDMIKGAIESFMNRDANQARDVAKQDENVDELFKQVFKLVANQMRLNHDVVPVGLNTISVISSLERIGDYVTNICESVVFLNTGDIVELN